MSQIMIQAPNSVRRGKHITVYHALSVRLRHEDGTRLDLLGTIPFQALGREGYETPNPKFNAHPGETRKAFLCLQSILQSLRHC